MINCPRCGEVLPDHVRSAEVPRGEPCSALTTREREVLTLAAQGLRPRQTSARVGLSVSTVRVILTAVRARLGAPNTTQAVLLGLARGLVDLDGPPGEPEIDGARPGVADTARSRA